MPNVNKSRNVVPNAMQDRSTTSVRRRSLRRKPADDENESGTKIGVGNGGHNSNRMLSHSPTANTSDDESNDAETNLKLKFAVPLTPKMTTRRVSKALDNCARRDDAASATKSVVKQRRKAGSGQSKTKCTVTGSPSLLEFDDESLSTVDHSDSSTASAHHAVDKNRKTVILKKRLDKLAAVSKSIIGKLKKSSKPATPGAADSNLGFSPGHRRSARRRGDKQNQNSEDTDTADDDGDASTSAKRPPNVTAASSTDISESENTDGHNSIKLFKYPVSNKPEAAKYRDAKLLFGWCPNFEALFCMDLDLARPTVYGYVIDEKKRERAAKQGDARSRPTSSSTTAEEQSEAYAVRTRVRAKEHSSNSNDADDDLEEERIPLKRILTPRVLSREAKDLIYCDGRGKPYRLMGEMTPYDIDSVLYDDEFLSKFRNGFPIDWRYRCNEFFIKAYKAEKERRASEQQVDADSVIDDKVGVRTRRTQTQTATAGHGTVTTVASPPEPFRRRAVRTSTRAVSEERSEIEKNAANEANADEHSEADAEATGPSDESNLSARDEPTAIVTAAAADKTTTVHESPLSLVPSPPSSSSPAGSVVHSPANSRRSSIDVRGEVDITANTAPQSSSSSPSRVSHHEDEEEADGEVDKKVLLSSRVSAASEHPNSDDDDGEQNEEPPTINIDGVCEFSQHPEDAEDAVGNADPGSADQSISADAVEENAPAHREQQPPVSVDDADNDAQVDEVIGQLLSDLINTTVEKSAIVDVVTTINTDTSSLQQSSAGDDTVSIAVDDERFQRAVSPSGEISTNQPEVEQQLAVTSSSSPSLPADETTPANMGDVSGSDAERAVAPEVSAESGEVRLPSAESQHEVSSSSEIDSTPQPPPRQHRTVINLAASPPPAMVDDNHDFFHDDAMENEGMDAESQTKIDATNHQHQAADVDTRMCQYEDVSDEDDSAAGAANAISDFEAEISKLDLLLLDQQADENLVFASEDDYLMRSTTTAATDALPHADLHPPQSNATSDARNPSCSALPPTSSMSPAATPMQHAVNCSNITAPEAVQQQSGCVYYAVVSAAEPTTYYDVNAVLQTASACGNAQQQHMQQQYGWAQPPAGVSTQFGNQISTGVSQQPYYQPQQQQQQSMPVLRAAEPMQVDDVQLSTAAAQSQTHLQPLQQQHSQQLHPQVVFYDDWQVRHAPEIREFLGYPAVHGNTGEVLHDHGGADEFGRKKKAPLMHPLQPVLLPEFGQYRCAADNSENENQVPFSCRDMFAGKSENFFGLYSSLFQSGLLSKSHSYGRIRDIEPIDLETYVREHVRNASGQAKSNASQRTTGRKTPTAGGNVESRSDETDEDEDGQNDSDLERHRNYHATLRPGGRAAAPRRMTTRRRTAAEKVSLTAKATPSKRQLASPSAAQSEASGMPDQHSLPPAGRTATASSSHGGQERPNVPVPTFTDAVVRKSSTTTTTGIPNNPAYRSALPPFKRQKPNGIMYSPRPQIAPKKPVATSPAALAARRAKNSLAYVRKNQASQAPRIPIAAVAAAAASDAVLDKRLVTASSSGSNTQYYSQAAQPFLLPSSSSTAASPQRSSSRTRKQSQIVGENVQSKAKEFAGNYAASSRHAVTTNNSRFFNTNSTSALQQPAIPMEIGDETNVSTPFYSSNGSNSLSGRSSTTQFFDAVDAARHARAKTNYYNSGILPPEAVVATRFVVQQPRQQPHLSSKLFFS